MERVSARLAVELATFLRRKAFLRRSTRPGHRRPALLDQLTRIGMAVLVSLDPAARIVRPVRLVVI